MAQLEPDEYLSVVPDENGAKHTDWTILTQGRFINVGKASMWVFWKNGLTQSALTDPSKR